MLGIPNYQTTGIKFKRKLIAYLIQIRKHFEHKTIINYLNIYIDCIIDGTPLQIHTFLPLTLTVNATRNVSSTLFIMWTIRLQSLKLLGPTVYVEMHLQENTVFELELGIKVIQNIAQHPLHHVT